MGREAKEGKTHSKKSDSCCKRSVSFFRHTKIIYWGCLRFSLRRLLNSYCFGRLYSLKLWMSGVCLKLTLECIYFWSGLVKRGECFAHGCLWIAGKECWIGRDMSVWGQQTHWVTVWDGNALMISREKWSIAKGKMHLSQENVKCGREKGIISEQIHAPDAQDAPEEHGKGQSGWRRERIRSTIAKLNKRVIIKFSGFILNSAQQMLIGQKNVCRERAGLRALHNQFWAKMSKKIRTMHFYFSISFRYKISIL